nr:anthrone oxygenase family protein [Roseomonas rosulenta]
MVVLLHAAALLAAVLAAGLFCTFSTVVMRGLDATAPQAAMRAMQRINDGIRTPIFDFTFFGALLLPLLLALAAWADGQALRAAWAGSAFLAYGLGAFVVTILANVPLNLRLAKEDPDGPSAAETWRSYSAPWTAWNHVRSLASLLACALLVLTLLPT